MTDLINKIWVEKYRPKDINEYVFQDNSHSSFIAKCIEEQNIPHLLLSGVQGTGKTSLSRILINALGVNEFDVMTINASDENSVQVIREKVNGFISTLPYGEFKVVNLEECDMISFSGQAALKHIIEERSGTARFIMTCNSPHKVIAPIKSRCQHLHFKAPDKKQLALRMISILKSENIEFKPKVLGQYIDVYYPDFRKIIQGVQQNCINNELIEPKSIESNSDYKFDLLDLIGKDDWKGARKIVCNQVGNEEIESIYKFLYTNLNQSSKFKDNDNWEQGQLLIAQFLYRDALIADREINLSALFISLGQI